MINKMLMEIKKERLCGIDILRIAAALMVCVLHFNMSYALPFYREAENYTACRILTVFSCLSTCAVDVFMLMSGYLLYERPSRSPSKVLRLLIEVVAVKLIAFGVFSTFSETEFSWELLLPGNYFIIFYCAVYLVSPMVNAAVKSIGNTRLILTLTLVLFSLWPTLTDSVTLLTGLSSLSTVTMTGMTNGFDIVNFLLMYLVGACIRREKDSFARVPGIMLAAGYVLSALVCYIGNSKLPVGDILSAYSSPVVILQSVCLFLLFIRIPAGSSPVLRSLAGATFTVFLGQFYFFPSLKALALRDSILPSLALIGAGLVMIYFILWLFDLAYERTVNRLLKRLIHIPDIF